MILNHNIDSGGNLDVTCMVENVYPEPTINLLWNESKLAGEQYIIDKRGGNCVVESDFEDDFSGSGSGDYAQDTNEGSAASEQEECPLLDIKVQYQHDVNDIYHSSGPGGQELSAIELGCEMALPEPFLDVMLVKKMQIQLVPEVKEEEDGGSGDGGGDVYDNDWLNVYNDTASGDGDTEPEVICIMNHCGTKPGTVEAAGNTFHQRSLLYQCPILILLLLLW